MKQNPQGPGYNSKVTNEENMTHPQGKKKNQNEPQYNIYWN